MTSLHDQARTALLENDPGNKIELASQLLSDWFLKMDDNSDELQYRQDSVVESIPQPGRPARPRLVSYGNTPIRSLGQAQGKAAFVHAIAHIEFNAINLALDAVYRFRQLPALFYTDWLKIAVEEGRHFRLLTARLHTLGYQYGDFEAHNGLWEMAMLTEHSLLERMALVPRLLEARGLDVTPKMIHRLQSMDDHQTVAILDIILREEIGHVAAGTRWYNYACEQAGLDPVATFPALLEKYNKMPLPGPLNEQARLDAGFSQQELVNLVQKKT